MNALAEDLNEKIRSANPYAFEMLSSLGKRFYFPSKGILSQGADAKKMGRPEWNATIGTGMNGSVAMHLPALMEQLPGINPNEALLYAPSPGLPKLREAWKKKTLHDNPDLEGKAWSLPIVTNGLSHGLSLIADMVADEGDLLILPEQNWGNYKLNFLERKGAVAAYYPLFKQGGFNLSGLEQALANAVKEGRKKVIVLLNFPNNPTGYTPSEEEGVAIAALLKRFADGGLNLVVIVDDAYYSLFFQPQVMRQSLFSKLAGLHPRILAFKADAATKEVYVWGLRVGFVSVSIGGVKPEDPFFEAMNAKMGGLIRAVLSNCSALSQLLVANAISSPKFYEQRAANAAILKSRAEKVTRVLQEHPEYGKAWEAYPFNSGYFMCLKIKNVDAADLRIHILKKYQVGTIAISSTDLRIAFSSIEEAAIPQVFDFIWKGWNDLYKG